MKRVIDYTDAIMLASLSFGRTKAWGENVFSKAVDTRFEQYPTLNAEVVRILKELLEKQDYKHVCKLSSDIRAMIEALEKEE